MKPGHRLSCTLIAAIGILWLCFFPLFKADFLNRFYFMPFLGIIAATVANTTPAAAGIVYFPILTRLAIDPATAVQFSLIIQAYGMGLGTFSWFMLNRSLFIRNVIPVCLCGGTLGVTAGIVFFPIENSELLTLTFNFIALMFTQIIFFSILFKHRYPNLTIRRTPVNFMILFLFSVIGGMISGWIGFGIDTIFYFILTVGFKINPAASIVTSISLMAAISLIGTFLNAVFHQVPLSLWFSAIPGVTLAGLFLAAYLAVKIGARNVLLLFTMLLCLDFFMVFWTQDTIPMSQSFKIVVTYVLVVYLLFIHVKIFKQSYKQIQPDLGNFSGRNGAGTESEGKPRR